MTKPSKTIRIATWQRADGTWFQTDIEKKGRWYVWFDDESSGERRSDHIDGPRHHAESLGGRIDRRPNPHYDAQMQNYLAATSSIQHMLGKLLRPSRRR